MIDKYKYYQKTDKKYMEIEYNLNLKIYNIFSNCPLITKPLLTYNEKLIFNNEN